MQENKSIGLVIWRESIIRTKDIPHRIKETIKRKITTRAGRFRKCGTIEYRIIDECTKKISECITKRKGRSNGKTMGWFIRSRRTKDQKTKKRGYGPMDVAL